MLVSYPRVILLKTNFGPFELNGKIKHAFVYYCKDILFQTRKIHVFRVALNQAISNSHSQLLF